MYVVLGEDFANTLKPGRGRMLIELNSDFIPRDDGNCELNELAFRAWW